MARPTAAEPVGAAPGKRSTVYDARPERGGLRPTLRLRLTLLNGILLVGAAVLLVLLAELLVDGAVRPAHQLAAGTQVRMSDGRLLDVQQWQRQLLEPNLSRVRAGQPS